jgi:FkbM family methyltransferase
VTRSDHEAPPWRLRLAQLTRFLPPVVAGRSARLIYPRSEGVRDSLQFQVRAVTGSRFAGTSGDFHAHRFASHGYSDWRLLAVALALCSRGDTILEIGAQAGTETVGYSDIVGPHGKVVAFEPMPAHVQALQQLLPMMRYSNVTVLPFALGAREGATLFAVPGPEQSTGTGHVLGPRERKSETVTYYDEPVLAEVVEVECRTLESFLSDFPRVALIVCDAEGSEVEIVHGATTWLEHRRTPLVVEASPPHLARAGTTISHLYEKIASFDYQISEIGRLSLLRVDPADPMPTATWNWLCLPSERRSEAVRVERILRRSGLSPCVPIVNPLTSPRRSTHTSGNAAAKVEWLKKAGTPGRALRFFAALNGGGRAANPRFSQRDEKPRPGECLISS